MSSTAQTMNETLLTQRENARLGKTGPQFASELLEGGSLRVVETELKKARDASAKTFANEYKKPGGKQDSLTNKTVAFHQDFALHRDFKVRYATTDAIRRKGVHSSRQKHYLASVFHQYMTQSS